MSIRAVRWTGFAVVGVGLLWASGCKVASVDGNSLYACAPDGCTRTGYTCWSDGLCHSGAEHPGQSDGGVTDGGQSDAGQSDAGQSDAGQSDAGQSDAGETDGGVRLGTVRLRFPPNGAYTGSAKQTSDAWRRIELEWWPVDGGSSYEVAYAECPGTGNCAFDLGSAVLADAGAATTYSLGGLEGSNPPPPPIERRYHWAVRACGADGACGDWSSARYFDVGHPGSVVPDDLDGDGKSELVWGLPQAGSAAGGSAVGFAVRFADGDAGFRSTADSDFGRSVEPVGDVRGDGASNFFVGTTEPWKGDAGIFYPVHAFGRTLGMDAPDSESFDGFGGLGDVNGDGYSDYFLVSDAGDSINSNGQAQPLPSDVGTRRPVIRTGDVDGDGYDDFIVFFPKSLNFELYSGVKAWNVGLVLPFTYDAKFVCAAGDVNGDGFADLVYQPDGGSLTELLGALTPGAGSVVSGAPTNVVGCAKAGDVDGDGFADVLIRQADAGVRILLGSDAGLSGPGVALIPPSTPGNGTFGANAFGVGDTNGDGFADVVVEYGPPVTSSTTCQSFALYQSDGGMLSASGGRLISPPDDTSDHSNCSMAAAP